MEPEQWYQRAPELELLCDRRELRRRSWSSLAIEEISGDGATL